VPGGGDLWGGEERSIEVGARSALRDLTCRILFERSERSERSELSGTTSMRVPQRSRSEAKTAPPGARAGRRLPRRAERMNATARNEAAARYSF
jgi:hypothetical protein